jgi:IgGFc binding protein
MIQRRARLPTLILALGAPLAAIVACSSSRPNFDERNNEFGGNDAASDGGLCGFRCSADLKKVLKGCVGAEEVIATCGPDQGCGIDTCIDACESAARSKGSIGCSFWTLPPDDSIEGPGACFAALVANTWDRPVSLRAELGGQPIDISKSVYTATRTGSDPEVYTAVDGPLPVGQVGVVFLSQAAASSDPSASRCPKGVVTAVNVDPIRHGTTKTVAFHLITDAPIAAYSIFPYGGAASFYPASTMLLPVSSWDKSYIAVSPGKFGNPQEGGRLNRRTIQIVANEDGTRVLMRPKVDIGGGIDVKPVRRGELETWTLARGEVLQLTQFAPLSGTAISTNKPVGLFGGSPCTFIPVEKGACDLTQQQIAPFAQWGTEYPLVPYRPRAEQASGAGREIVPWTFVGAVDGTNLVYEPARPPGAPETLAAGQVADFMTDAIVVVRSQDSKHPFYVGVQMTGHQYANGGTRPSNFLGDPDFVNVVATDQFLDRYIFFTDYTYPETTLSIVRRKTSAGFAPVELECAGAIDSFVPLGTSGELEYAWVRLTSNFIPQKFANGSCGYGRHEAHSAGPFSVTVWGTGDAASYGYTGGMGARPINDAPPPVVQ